MSVPVLRPDSRSSSRFRPDLEGLRAVAVVMVVAFHMLHAGTDAFAGSWTLPGGFVGVDVFFVLSGFLITGILLRELRGSGSISLSQFYARRIRRLLPAAALVLVVTVALSAMFLSPLLLPAIGRDALAAALYASNIRFAGLGIDYLGSQLPDSPLLHYWSLGVEEQFYLFWPLLLVAVVKLGGGLNLRRVGVLIGVVGTISFIASVYMTSAAQPLAFFLLPTRAWELALGAGLAVVGIKGLRLSAEMGRAASLAGIVLIVASAMLINQDMPYPGWLALAPTMGAALVIASGLSHAQANSNAFLGSRVMGYLGRISYSLYLWHWPLITIPVLALGATKLDIILRVVLVMAAVALAALSERFVERPIRYGRLLGSRPRRTMLPAAALTLALVTVSLNIGFSDDVAVVPGPSPTPIASAGASPTPAGTIAPDSELAVLLGAPGALASPAPGPASGPVPADLRPALAAASKDSPIIYDNGCHLQVTDLTSDVTACSFGDKASSKVVVLFGDSHAAQWFPAMERLALANGWRLVSMTKSACPFADITVWNKQYSKVYTECDSWRADSLAKIADLAPIMVVTSSVRYDLIINGKRVPTHEREDLWTTALTTTFGRLKTMAKQVVYIIDTPRPEGSQDPPVCLSNHSDDMLACANTREHALQLGYLSPVEPARASGVAVIDPTPWVCPADPCPAVMGSYLVYRDREHLTATFDAALAPYLAQQLPALP